MRPVTTDLGLLRRIERLAPSTVRGVLTRLARNGARAVLVGGAVRDACLGRPVLDWDVATDALPQRVAGLFQRVSRKGERHGTIMVLTTGGPVEVTTFRGEGAYTDGRRPSSVQFHTDLEQDLARRDFTINAVAVELDSRRVVDPFGGRWDLERRVVRCVGDPRERFEEDGLRPLRAVRFSAVLDFGIARETAQALTGAVPTLERIAAERRRDEMLKIFSDAVAVMPAIRVLLRTGMLDVVAPELVSAGTRPARALDRFGTGNPWLRLAAWMVGAKLDRAAVTALCERWRLSRADGRRIQAWVAALADLPPKPPTGPGLRAWLAAHGADESHAAARLAQVLRSGYAGFTARVGRELRRAPPITVADLALGGVDLTAMGLVGPAVGALLRQLLWAVIEDPSLNQRDRLMELAHRLSTGGQEPGIRGHADGARRISKRRPT